MNCLIAASKALIGLAVVVLFATALPAFAAAVPEGRHEPAAADAGKKPADGEGEARQGETCAAADGNKSCKAPAGFPPLDLAASLFSAMAGCSGGGL